MKEEIKEELQEIAPFLANLKKEDPFKTPKFYFERLEDSILEKVQPEKIKMPVASKQVHSSLISQFGHWVSTLLQPRWAMALALITILAAGSWFLKKQQNTETTQTLSEITTEDIHQYVNANIDDFDEELLVENTAFEADNAPKDALLEGEIFNDLNDEELEKYLKEQPDYKD